MSVFLGIGTRAAIEVDAEILDRLIAHAAVEIQWHVLGTAFFFFGHFRFRQHRELVAQIPDERRRAFKPAIVTDVGIITPIEHPGIFVECRRANGRTENGVHLAQAHVLLVAAARERDFDIGNDPRIFIGVFIGQQFRTDGNIINPGFVVILGVRLVDTEGNLRINRQVFE